MTTMTATTSKPVPSVTRESRLVLRVTADELDTASGAALRPNEYVAVLSSVGLGLPATVTGTRIDGEPYDDIVLNYGGETRTWTKGQDLHDEVTYLPAQDTSSTGYVGRATR